MDLYEGVFQKYSAIYNEIQALLQNSPKVLILGIGENRMGDDGAGQLISFGLDKFNGHPQICVINGGITPEERLSEIEAFQPDVMIVVDVIDLKSPPGTVRLFGESQMANYLPISSHSMPLPVFMDRCKRVSVNVKIVLLGICPYSLEFLDRYALFEEDRFSLDEKEENPNIPFYDFNLSPEMEQIGKELISLLSAIFESQYC